MKNIKLWLYQKIFKKDTMQIIIEHYRKNGALIGNNVRTFSPINSAEPYLIEIGDNVTISSNVNFITHDNSVSKVLENVTDTFGKIVVGDNCFIGLGSILLPGIIIGDNTIIAAGSVVTKSFKEGNCVIGGNPARFICTTEEYAVKIKDNALSTLGLSFEQKKNYLNNNHSYFLNK